MLNVHYSKHSHINTIVNHPVGVFAERNEMWSKIVNIKLCKRINIECEQRMKNFSLFYNISIAPKTHEKIFAYTEKRKRCYEIDI